jgi:hypothetical protein
VFADDSSQLIDGNTATVYGNIQATTLRTAETKIALGENAGLTSQGSVAVAIGSGAGESAQGSGSVSIGVSSGSINQNVEAVAIGRTAGFTTQGIAAVAIGLEAGQQSQGFGAVAIGDAAGKLSQGGSSVAIGGGAGETSQPANTIILNATGVAVNGVALQTNSFYVAPIRTTANGTPLMYNSTTKEITYSNVLEFVGSTISTSDSSGITVDVQTTFNTDVTVENDLNVTQRLRVQGSRVINITELQAIVAASTDFAAFKTAIAGLV